MTPNVVSLEAKAHGDMPARMEGIDAIRKKNQWWLDNHTIHANTVSGPFPHGDRFIVHYKIDVTPKAGPMAGKRMQAEETGLYTVRDGRWCRKSSSTTWVEVPGRKRLSGCVRGRWW